MSKQVMSFHYTLTNSSGESMDTSQGKEPLMFLVGEGGIIPGLEKVLVKMKTGERKKVVVPAVEAYGEFDETLIHQAPRSEVPGSDKVKVGDTFSGGHEKNTSVFTVTKVDETHITLDGNHSLAGQELTFYVEIVEVREATAEELQHGHAHSPGGHHHH